MKKTRFVLFLVFCCCLPAALWGREQRFVLTSPDGRLSTHIVFTSVEEVTYDIVSDGVTLLLPSHIGLNRVYGKNVTGSMALEKASSRKVDEAVASPFTRQASMRDCCNEMTFRLKGGLFLDFRAYNEGIAYRFRTAKACTVRYEKVEYNLAGDWTATAPYVSQFSETNPDCMFSTSFENLYTTCPLSQLDSRRLCFLPLLVHGPAGQKICLTETHLEHFPGLYLKGLGAGGRLEGVHAPYPKECEQGGHNNLQLLVKSRENYIARLSEGDELPWRIAMVSRRDADLAANNLSYLLAAPCRVDDLGWIKPGKVAWDWWNCWNLEGVPFRAGINNDTYKYYIDFAAAHGIEYVILDEGWAVNLQADLLQVVPEIDLPMLSSYAAERGVGLILWAGYYAFARDMENVCRHYSEMGIKGFKIDFMDRDDQAMTDFYYQAAAMCAKYRLLVDFHGAFKPAGLNRAYPNVLNFEGVAGLEQLKWAPASWNQVQYDTEIPFIRQAAGPLDYTQGAMRNAAKGCYAPLWSEPMSQGTRCHQLGLYVVLESPLNMLCDSPTNYEKEPDYTRFVAGIPTVWDETCVLDGRVGEYVVTARRRGGTWYVGGITNWTARDIEVDLSALGIAAYSGTLVCDGANADRKGSDYRMQPLNGTGGVLKIHLAPGGGFVAKIN